MNKKILSWLVVFKRLNLWRDEIQFRILLIVKHFNQTNGTKHFIYSDQRKRQH